MSWYINPLLLSPFPSAFSKKNGPMIPPDQNSRDECEGFSTYCRGFWNAQKQHSMETNFFWGHDFLSKIIWLFLDETNKLLMLLMIVWFPFLHQRNLAKAWEPNPYSKFAIWLLQVVFGIYFPETNSTKTFPTEVCRSGTIFNFKLQFYQPTATKISQPQAYQQRHICNP